MTTETIPSAINRSRALRAHQIRGSVPTYDWRAHERELLRTENAKTSKGESLGWLTAILYLSPKRKAADLTGLDFCVYASLGCEGVCLDEAGRGKMDSVQEARIAKSVRFAKDPQKFVDDLIVDVARMERAAKRASFKLSVRLNGTSDLPWETLRGSEGLSCMEAFPHVQFYDYTKDPRKAIAFAKGKLPANYHVTFSRSEENEAHALRVLRAGGNVAVVFAHKKGEVLPKRWKRFPVIDGDVHDLRFLDKRASRNGQVVGLRAKGDARHDKSGFVVHVG